MPTCKGVTRQGDRCRFPQKIQGYCVRHYMKEFFGDPHAKTREEAHSQQMEGVRVAR